MKMPYSLFLAIGFLVPSLAHAKPSAQFFAGNVLEVVDASTGRSPASEDGKLRLTIADQLVVRASSEQSGLFRNWLLGIAPETTQAFVERTQTIAGRVERRRFGPVTLVRDPATYECASIGKKQLECRVQYVPSKNHKVRVPSNRAGTYSLSLVPVVRGSTSRVGEKKTLRVTARDTSSGYLAILAK